ncbi:MAG: hypothetical protein K6U02_05780 [Firmicutes bacterium]|nr:hypothetical protein [Bacillota bacterium]
MPAIITVDDYLDPDVAYLLGLVTARGQFHVDGDIRRLIINFRIGCSKHGRPKAAN